MFQAVVSTYHAKIKFHVNELAVEVKGDRPERGGMLPFMPHINQIDLLRPIPDEKAKYDMVGHGEEKRLEVDPGTKEQQHVYPREELHSVEIDLDNLGRLCG